MLKSLIQKFINPPFIDFLGIGAQKSGTTWLYENLKRHQQIFMPEIKEIHFFDEHFKNGLDWYKALFSAGKKRKKGEITPAYAILEAEKIKFIKGINKNLKIIYILRNPIERAWSAALMDLKRANLKFEETPDIWFINHFKSEGSLKRGDYEACAQNWLKFFPKKNILILDYNEIIESPENLLNKCAAHLSINKTGFNPEKLNEKIFAGEGQAIRPTLLKTLNNIYSEKILQQKEFFLREFGINLSY